LRVVLFVAEQLAKRDTLYDAVNYWQEHVPARALIINNSFVIVY